MKTRCDRILHFLFKIFLIVGFISAGIVAFPSFGQGYIGLDNYNTEQIRRVTYGAAGIPANGVSGSPGAVGTGLYAPSGGWTAGFYWTAGDQTANVVSDPSNIGIPTGGGLTLATGPGSTAFISGPQVGSSPGYFSGSGLYQTVGVAAGGTITVQLVAYSGTDYASANYRGHSEAFTMPVGNLSPPSYLVGDYMPAFSVYIVPEPSVVVFGGMVLGIFIFRLRKSASRK
jgi:hypothetical protein